MSGKRHAEWLLKQQEWERKEAIRIQKEQARKHAEALAAAVQARAAALLKAAENWRLSLSLSGFTDECETRWRNQSGQLAPEQIHWLAWAREIATAKSPFSVGYPDSTNDGAFDPSSIPVGGPYPEARDFEALKRARHTVNDSSRDSPPEASPSE